MFWVLKRTVSSRRFFWVPTTYVLVQNWKAIFWYALFSGGLCFSYTNYFIKEKCLNIYPPCLTWVTLFETASLDHLSQKTFIRWKLAHRLSLCWRFGWCRHSRNLKLKQDHSNRRWLQFHHHSSSSSLPYSKTCLKRPLKKKTNIWF